ncbi:winged helix-turn-helix transcriptional regulator [Actinocrispum wychmicini]|uniref:winged helix-turn-helix transcriptional regulator n=1 Tax=Actinocrispum wychmicini TaxID=1213861 RepID=UPI001A9EFF8C|nr:helix-turn-helix domain-containing protein [Actinocrispum wychmicini]
MARSVGLVADPWALLVLRDLFLGLNRFEQLYRDLGVATNVLAERLDRLVDAGLVVREPYQHHPVRHEYQLTESGKDFYGVVLSLLAWGDKHLADDGAPMLLMHATCGHQTTPVVTCDHCGAELHADQVTVLPGPGGRAGPGTTLIAELLTGPGSPG